MSIQYDHSRLIDADEFVDLLRRSTLAERRPVDDSKCIKAMLKHADLLYRMGRREVGWGGPFCDGLRVLLLSFDLAVDVKYQKQGIGRELIRLTRSRLGKRADDYPALRAEGGGVLPANRLRRAPIRVGSSRGQRLEMKKTQLLSRDIIPGLTRRSSVQPSQPGQAD